MCGEQPCGPCAEKKKPCGVPFAVVQAGTGDLVIWGPASVEVVSEDDKLIEISAVEQALPDLLITQLLSVLHKDQPAGRVEASITLNEERAPTPKARALIQHLGGVGRTEVREITPEIAQAFPKLAPKVGERALFVAARLYSHNETTRTLAQEVLEGKLDSFSISGMATRAVEQAHCDTKGCRTITRVRSMNLSAVTLASTTHRPGPWAAKARNPLAALLVVQQSEAHDMTTTEDKEPEAPPASDEAVGEQQEELTRRIENLEQDVSAIKGTRADSAPPETAATDLEKKDEEEQAADEPEDGDDTMTDEKKTEKKEEVAQAASPAATAPVAVPTNTMTNNTVTGTAGNGIWVAPSGVTIKGVTIDANPPNPLAAIAKEIEQAVARALDARLAAIEQAKAPAPSPAKTVEQSAVPAPKPAASTPAPAAPAHPDTRTASASVLVEAANTGNPVLLKRAFRELSQSSKGGTLQ